MTLPPRRETSYSQSINAHFFFVDIVGLSDPSMSTKTQIKKIEVLNRCILETEVYQTTKKESLLTLPTGDGMCLGFLQGPELPLHLAVQLQEKLAKYNNGKIPSENVRVRILKFFVTLWPSFISKVTCVPSNSFLNIVVLFIIELPMKT